MTGCADAILAAIRREFVERRPHLDRADDIGEVQVTVRLRAGTTAVTSVTWQEDRVMRAMRRPDHLTAVRRDA
jgi:hypothetical protein